MTSEHEGHDVVKVWPELNGGYQFYCRHCVRYFKREGAR